MKIFKYIFIILFGLGGGLFITSKASNIWISNDTIAYNTIWEEKIYQDISFLADSLCDGRACGTRGNVESAFWIWRKFKKSGLIPFDGSYAKKVYTEKGVVGHNIMGMFPGCSKGENDSYIIIGAHFDHIGRLKNRYYPGADANASGVVAMTSIAHMFSSLKTLGKKYDSNIIFVGFDANQLSLAGSNTLWNSIKNGDLKDPINGKTITEDKIKLMVNLEQIGTSQAPLSSNRKDFLIMLGNNNLPPKKQKILGECNKFYGINLQLCYSYYGSEQFTKIFYTLSDQKVFIENNIPSVLFTSGITMSTNKTWDRADTIEYSILKKRIYLIFHWLEKVL